MSFRAQWHCSRTLLVFNRAQKATEDLTKADVQNCAMPWFPNERDSSITGWRFDIVGLLAIIGESIIADHTQAIRASHFSLFPCIIPAPQALLRTRRPSRLPSTKDVTVIGVHSHILLHELNFFADVIHDIGSLKDFEFRVYCISHSDKGQDAERRTLGDWIRRIITRRNRRKGLTGDTSQDVETASTAAGDVASVPMYLLCPLNIVTACSILMTSGLIVWAACIRDGPAFVALVAISISTSLACLSSQWRPELTRRPTMVKVPPGDVIIKTRGAAFVVVKCTEEITRELYGGTEKCNYVIGNEWHKALVTTSTVLLMVSVVLLGNSGWTMQAAIGTTYIILNILYWGIPLIGRHMDTWDLRAIQSGAMHETGDAECAPFISGSVRQVGPSQLHEGSMVCHS